MNNILAVFLCASSLGSAQIAASYYVDPLPYPSGSRTGSTPSLSGINNAGQVGGITFLNSGSSLEAFISSPAGVAALPVTNVNSVLAINNAGQVVGNAGGGNQTFQAYVASTSGSSLLPASQGFTPFRGSAINDSGQVAGYATNASNFQQAFVGTTAGVSIIPLPLGWTSSIGTGINSSGQVTGYGTLSSGFNQPFLYNGSSTTPLPQPPSAAFAFAYAINDSGQVAGYVQNGQAFTETVSGATMIPLPSGAPQFSFATVSYGSINNSGVIVGQVSNQQGTVLSGWIWDAAQGTISLNSLVPAGWNILNAVSISNSGLILAEASYNNGPVEWVELTTTPIVCNYSLSPASIAVSAIGGNVTFTVNTSSGCNWNTAVGGSTFLQIASGYTGNGTGTVTVQVDPNISGTQQVGSITAGEQTFTVTQAPVALEPISINNASGSGTTQNFTFQFTDPAGWNDLQVIDVLINDYLDGQHACYVAVTPPLGAGYLYMVDDAGDGGYVSGTPMPLASGGSLQNSQCSVAGGVSYLGTGGSPTQIVLTLSITFKPGFAGNKIIYTAIRGGSGNSGWQAMGTWNVPGSSPTGPAVSGMTPGRSTTTGQTYTFTFTDTNGYTDLNVLDILTNGFLDGISACYVAYVPTGPTTGYVYLVDDGGDGGYAAGSPLLLSSGGTLQNNQCTINTAGSSASASGNNLNLNLAITFKAGFAGNQVFYLAARNSTTGNSGWQPVGSVTVP